MENDDLKYVYSLSAILVATIEEAKDKISQVEYIFCTQLFPNIQSKSKLLGSAYEVGRRAAEDEWKSKENELFLRIEQLESEKQQTLQENLSLKLEKASNIKEQQENTSGLRVQIERQQLIIDELELNLRKKSTEVDEGLKLEKSLLQLIQSKGFEIVDKEKQSKRLEERIIALLNKISNLDREVNELQDQLKEKTEIAAKREELVRDLVEENKSQASQITENKQVMRDQEKERQKLTANLRSLEETVHQLRSCQNVNLNGSELSKHLEDSEKENKLLSTKVNALEEKINELQIDLRDRTNDMSKVKDLYQTALEQIESKTAELLAAQGKARDVVDAYKRLKSQYNYLCKKSGLSEENMTNALKSHNEPDSPKHIESQISPNIENRDGEAEAKRDNSLNNEKSEAPDSSSPTLSIAPKCNSTVKSAKIAGSKRRATSRWRDTRSPQGQNGLDPHDDFLNTPLEIIRGNLNKVPREEACEKQIPAPKEKKLDISDDETQDVTSPDQSSRKNPRPELVTKGKGYKFMEPVRKKADRENLKGVECRQCKKFYDAVLCGDDDKDGNNDKQNIRCEHHEGVSRHRYRYVPPMTPEGFWNIGFESEM